jgi:hypothetical protein
MKYYQNSTMTIVKVRKVGKKRFKKFEERTVSSHPKHIPTPTAFKFPHAAPLPNRPTASSVNAMRKQKFLYSTIVTRMPGIQYLKINR